ncbi:FadR family transcriptional regulator [Parasphingopyxis algicola]|uniref:FadR/GntR family transcriptional regulator n=1 Tax=Parasphingopyxis algicola TaxID=2026624 RepID=UPI0015A33B99|nr:GntR family transcriptional regulator [Parasphingopyxis algicola]QLC24921.1 FadR family transcriptional regulator [Parasphingopyxis algicola]
MRWSHAPIETVATYDVTVRRLRRQIQLGQLMPEERLPPERILAGHLGVSRMTLREALRVLETEGFITVKRGAKGGAFVCTIEKLDEIASARLARNPADTLRAMEFRMALEPAAARFAAERRTPAHIKRMESGLTPKEQVGSPALHYRDQVEFHMALVEASLNRWFVEAVTDSIANIFLPCQPNPNRDEIFKQVVQRRKILEAIKNREGDEAAALLETLLSSEFLRIQKMTNRAKRSSQKDSK